MMFFAGVNVDLLDMSLAKKDGKPILLKLKKDGFPEHCARFADQWFVGHHNGFDIGWMFSAPVGYGGFPDDWFEGWLPLPKDIV